jgi:hypothetical protein
MPILLTIPSTPRPIAQGACSHLGMECVEVLLVLYFLVLLLIGYIIGRG